MKPRFARSKSPVSDGGVTVEFLALVWTEAGFGCSIFDMRTLLKVPKNNSGQQRHLINEGYLPKGLRLRRFSPLRTKVIGYPQRWGPM
jgi:hypothetical protein